MASPAPSSFTVGGTSVGSSAASGSRSTTPAASGSGSLSSDKRGAGHEHLYKSLNSRSSRRHAPTLATGRRDLKHETGLPMDEAERRRVRRERNRTAAAKCRRKRMDITSELQAVRSLLFRLHLYTLYSLV